ncbi:MAG TPA: hypothetical protein VMH50_04695 [Thermoleophilia bacterium]|nr:hypothetical protein [Thermoleophilia bacterium]
MSISPRARRYVLSPVAFVLSALIFGTAVASAAGSWTPLPQSVCYSDGSWFTSTNVRTVHSGNSAIKLKVSQAPGGGLAFYVKNYNTGNRIGSIVYSPPINTPLLCGSAPAGTDFVNVFKETEAGKKPYYWNGSEYY